MKATMIQLRWEDAEGDTKTWWVPIEPLMDMLRDKPKEDAHDDHGGGVARPGP